jgi:hypothetical protein
VHELRAVHGGGDDAGKEKQRRQTIFTKQLSRQLSRQGKQPEPFLRGVDADTPYSRVLGLVDSGN